MPFIATENNDKIYVTTNHPNQKSRGLLFFIHGLASNSDENVIKAPQQECLKNGWTTITFDCRHSFGKSSGELENARLKTYLEDLKNVINWAQKQPFYQEPFGLVGHSLGGATALCYTRENPDKVNNLILIAPVISGTFWEEACLKNIHDFYLDWKQKGSFLYQDPYHQDWKGNISFDVLKETFSYDATVFAEEIKAPVCIIVGKQDAVSLVEHNQTFYNKLHALKMLRILSDAEHTLHTEKNAKDLAKTCMDFLSMCQNPKLYYTYLFEKEILPSITKISNQPKYGYHGISHTEQVGLFALDYALALHKNPLPVLLAAGLHDCARTNDAYDETHGPRCIPIATSFLKSYQNQLTTLEEQQILYAIEHHTTGRKAPDYISACLWDGDRTRLSWERGYQEEYFTTARAKKIASLDDKSQQDYLEEQKKYLISLGLKTEEEYQIDKNTLIKMLHKTNFKN